MGLIGGLIGAGINAIGQGIAAKKLNKAYKQQQEIYNQRLGDIKAHRDAVYYADPTQSAENQAAVTQAQQLLDEQNKRAAATSVVTGGTDESAALAKASAAATVGNMMQQQAVQGAAKKEQAYQTAEQGVDSYSQLIANSKMAQAQKNAEAISSSAKGFGEVAAGMGPLKDLKW